MSVSKTNASALTARKIGWLNRVGLMTLVRKEVARFLNVYTQTIVAPVVTTLMFYAVFALAFGGVARHIGDVPYMAFLAPGLLMMSMVQNAFANTSSSRVIAKVQGNIVDLLMPPLSAAELLAGFIIGGVFRGLVVGLVTGIVISLFVPITIAHIGAVVLYGVLGTMMLACIGIAGGIWSQKFDHIAAVTNFIVTPLTFLSGTFYAMDSLPPAWQVLGHYNPFFYMIDGFRYGFIDHAESDLFTGAALLIVLNLALILLCHRMLVTGYKIKS